MIHQTKISSAPWMILLLGLALSLAPGQANAHELDPLRSVVAEVDDTSLSIMVIYEEIPGPRSDLLLARYDLDGNGKIEDQEALLASREMIARMLAGLQFEVDFETPKGHSPEIRFKTGPKGEISAAAFIRYDLSKLSSLPLPAHRKVHVRLLPTPDNISTEVVAIARPGIRLVHIFQPPNSTTKDGQTMVTAGQQWSALFAVESDTEKTNALPTPQPDMPDKSSP